MKTNNAQRIPGMSLSLWHATSEENATPTLVPLKDIDVCVVGAGIAGLTTAYMLMKEGKSVCVVDMGAVGTGETGQTSAHLSPVLGRRYYDLIDTHGKPGARVIADAHVSAIDIIEEIIKAENIDCDFERVNGYLFLGIEDSEENLNKERNAMLAVGLDCELVEAIPGVTFNSGPALRVSDQGRFHPMKYLRGLALAIRVGGGAIVRGKVMEFGQDEKMLTVTTESGRTFRTRDIVVATNSPVNSVVEYHTKQVAFRTYVVAFRIAKNSVPSDLMWDTATPYHYIRTAPFNEMEDLLLVGGADHQTGKSDDDNASPWDLVERWARKHFREAGNVEYRWSGQVMESIDGIGFNGRDSDDHTYVITGDCGNGLTNGTLGARIVSDIILGRENAWAKTFEAGRIPVKSIGEWLAGGATTIANLAKQVVNTDAPTCTHLGCVLVWNAAESSWDCPCHGSRYDASGKVLHGPAVTDLELHDAVSSSQTAVPSNAS